MSNEEKAYTCYKCGKPIVFRKIDGIVRPIHPPNS